MESLETLLSIALGLSLAATCGLRAFLPLGMISGLAAAGWMDLPAALEWMGSPVALLCFWTATVAEMVGDKVPLVDHAMDILGTAVRPAAGAIAGTALVAGADPLVTCVFGLAGGAAVAGTTHLGKAGLRAGSTGTTLGTGNTAISVVEDLITLGIGGAAVAAATMM